MSVAKAVYTRWNDAGLDTDVATLYVGEDEASPPGTSLPRAQYTIENQRTDLETVGDRVLIQPVTFRVWGTTFELIDTYLEAIDAAFHRSHAAASGPLQAASALGRVLSVTVTDTDRFREDEAVYQGVMQIEVRWSRTNTTP